MIVQLTIVLPHIFHPMRRLDNICKGLTLNLNLSSSKKEIQLKLKNLTLSDVDKLFKKVKEALEVSQLGVNGYKICIH